MQLSDAQLASLHEALQAVPDGRGRRGLRYPLPTVLTIVLGSRLAGCQTLTETSDCGRGLSQDALRRSGSRLRQQTQRYHAPGISTLHYVLKDIDIERVERILADRMKAQLPATRAVAMDGKTLRGSCNHDPDGNGQPREEAPGSSCRQSLSTPAPSSARSAAPAARTRPRASRCAGCCPRSPPARSCSPPPCTPRARRPR